MVINMFKKFVLVLASFSFTGLQAFAAPDSVALMKNLLNSENFAAVAKAESDKGFVLLNSVVVTNEINCPCYTVRATFQKNEAWPTDNAASTDTVMIHLGSTR